MTTANTPACDAKAQPLSVEDRLRHTIEQMSEEAIARARAYDENTAFHQQRTACLLEENERLRAAIARGVLNNPATTIPIMATVLRDLATAAGVAADKARWYAATTPDSEWSAAHYRRLCDAATQAKDALLAACTPDSILALCGGGEVR